jgi:transposase-like protein
MDLKHQFGLHHFPALIILSAVRMNLLHPLSNQDVSDLLGERGADL